MLAFGNFIAASKICDNDDSVGVSKSSCLAEICNSLVNAGLVRGPFS